MVDLVLAGCDPDDLTHEFEPIPASWVCCRRAGGDALPSFGIRRYVVQGGGQIVGRGSD